MTFVLEHVAGRAQLAGLPGGDAVEPGLVGQILEQASIFAAEELAPLNARGDQEGSRLDNGVVRTPEGWWTAREDDSGVAHIERCDASGATLALLRSEHAPVAK